MREKVGNKAAWRIIFSCQDNYSLIPNMGGGEVDDLGEGLRDVIGQGDDSGRGRGREGEIEGERERERKRGSGREGEGKVRGREVEVESDREMERASRGQGRKGE